MSVNGKKKLKKLHSPFHSITAQLVVAFGLVLVVIFFFGWILNSFFLERFYINKKEKAIISFYKEASNAYVNDTLYSSEFISKANEFSGKQNSGVAVVSYDLFGLPYFRFKVSSESDDIFNHEIAKVLNGDTTGLVEIIQEEDYVILRTVSENVNLEYLELVGELGDEELFISRTPLEGIRESVNIFNSFFKYELLVCTLVCIVVIIFISKRISKPILTLANISKRMANMDFDIKYEGSEKTEIAVLGQSINLLSTNLEAAISELKTANAKLLNDIAEKEKNEVARQEFISSVSHELKTPLAIIQGYAEGLNEGVNEEEKDYYLEVIMDEASKMNRMVKQLLTLNSLESGSEIISIERFDIIALINNYVQSMDLILKQNEITVVLPKEGPVYVWADEFRIEEVFMNYFSNAINHCESPNGKRIVVDVQRDETKAIISVFNTGKNIPEESLEHLWERFYKVDKARTREYGGSGVGLSIVKAIMEFHGQKYGVTNETLGVRFWFTLDAKN